MSKTISVETTINAPLNKVWDEVSQIHNHSNWMNAHQCLASGDSIINLEYNVPSLCADNDNSVTLRDRDTMAQTRLQVSELAMYIMDLVKK